MENKVTMDFKNSYTTSDLPNNFIQLRQLDKYLIGHKGYVAGGVFKNIFNKEKFKDVDIFFERKEDWHEANDYYKKNDEYVTAYSNNKVQAYRNTKTNVVVELINFIYGKPEEVVSKFDFTVVKFAYYKEKVNENEGEVSNVEWKILYHNKFFEHLHLKRLVIDQEAMKIDKPVNTLNRTYRYAKYGYFPCRETKVKIIDSLRLMPRFDDTILSNELYNGFD